MSEKTITYTENDRALVAALKGADHPMTIAELNEASGRKFVPGHIVSALKKGLIEKVGTIEVEKPSTRQISTYTFISADVMKKADGKDYDYSDSAKAILAAASKMDKPFTLAELSEAAGFEVKSGSIVALMKKGNIGRGERIEVPTIDKSEVSTYAFLADISDTPEEK